MQFLRDISIKRKLIGIIMATSTVALMLACSTFLAYELVTYRSTVTQQLTTLAQIVAESSTAALAFDDRRSAGETLAALRAEPNLVAACIYTKDGRPIHAQRIAAGFAPQSRQAGRPVSGRFSGAVSAGGFRWRLDRNHIFEEKSPGYECAPAALCRNRFGSVAALLSGGAAGVVQAATGHLGAYAAPG
jgi:hypothetical protein